MPAPRPARPAHLRARAARPRGAALTEFIVVGPLAILFTFVILQAGFLYMAKLTLNHAVFMAARAGAVENGRKSVIEDSLARGLMPFYQNAFDDNDLSRLSVALAKTKVALLNPLEGFSLDILSPDPQAFATYGIQGVDAGGRPVTYIPNDNLEFRDATPRGPGGRPLSLKDANILRIKVTYGYELKVPLMGQVVGRIMCGGSFQPSTGVKAWDGLPRFTPLASVSDCARYYLLGRVPLVSFATVQMQSPAHRF